MAYSNGVYYFESVPALTPPYSNASGSDENCSPAPFSYMGLNNCCSYNYNNPTSNPETLGHNLKASDINVDEVRAFVEWYLEKSKRKNIDEGYEQEDDQNNEPPKKRRRTTFSPEAIIQLEEAFKRNEYASSEAREELSTRLNIPAKTIKIWFQNRRMKQKKLRSRGNDACSQDLGPQETPAVTCTSAVLSMPQQPRHVDPASAMIQPPASIFAARGTPTHQPKPMMSLPRPAYPSFTSTNILMPPPPTYKYAPAAVASSSTYRQSPHLKQGTNSSMWPIDESAIPPSVLDEISNMLEEYSGA